MTPEKEQKLREAAEAFRDNLKDHFGREDDIDAFVDFAKSPEVSDYHKQQPAESEPSKNQQTFDQSLEE